VILQVIIEYTDVSNALTWYCKWSLSIQT